MKNTVFSQNGERSELDIVAIADWDGFDTLSDYLIENFDAILVEKLDGPDARVYTFSIDNTTISLHNNPYGNSLKGNGQSAQDAIMRIASDLEQRLT
jgi:Protein of unknown function (DUF3630)